MDSQEIKEMLDEWLEEIIECIPTCDESDFEKAIGKWKRLSKRKNTNGDWERVFNNTYLDKKVLVVEDEIKGFLADGKYVFHLSDSQYFAAGDYEYFKKNGYQSDWHLSDFILFPGFVGEEAEGFFSTEMDIETTRKALLDLGFVEDQEYSNFMKSHMK